MSKPPMEKAAYPRDDLGKSLRQFRELMTAYDRTNQVAYVYLGLMVLQFAIIAAPKEFQSLVSLVWFGGYFVFAALTVMACRVAAKAMNSSMVLVTILAVLAMFVPCGALILLIIVQQRILSKLKPYGVKARISGVSKKQRAEIEARLAAAQSPTSDMSKPPTMG